MPMYPSRSGRAFNTSKIRPHECTEKHLSETAVPLKLKAISTRCYKQAIRFRGQIPSDQGNDICFAWPSCLHIECSHTYTASQQLKQNKTNKKNTNPQLISVLRHLYKADFLMNIISEQADPICRHASPGRRWCPHGRGPRLSPLPAAVSCAPSCVCSPPGVAQPDNQPPSPAWPPLRPVPSRVRGSVQETQILLLRQIRFSVSPYPWAWLLAGDLRDYLNSRRSLWDADLHWAEPTAVQKLLLHGDGAAMAGNYPNKKRLVFWFLIQLKHLVTSSRDHNVT